MSSIQFVTPSEQLTLTDRKDYRCAALAAGIERCYQKAIGNRDDIPGLSATLPLGERLAMIAALLKNGGSPKSLDIREFQPLLDVPGLVAAAGLDSWVTAVLAGINTFSSVFSTIPAPVNPANRTVVFWKVGVETAGFPVSRIVFRTGGITGNILANFDLEQLVNAWVPEGYFSEPVVIDPQQTYAVQVRDRGVLGVSTGLVANVQLGAFVFEPAGTTAS